MGFISNKMADLLALALSVTVGLRDNLGIFLSPPVDSKQIGIQKEALEKLLADEIATSASLKEIRINIKAAARTLTHSLAIDKEYCKEVAGGNAGIFSKSGFKPAKAKVDPRHPGQCGDFRIASRNKDGIKFIWRTPSKDTGGITTIYQFLLKGEMDADYTIMANPVKNSITIPNQEAGKVMEFCVVAVNAMGAGPRSNSVIVKF